MKSFVFAFAYLLAANLQVGFFVVSASFCSRFLDERYNLGFSWKLVLLPTSIILSVYFYFHAIRAIVRLDKGWRK